LRRLGIVRSDEARATFEFARGELMSARVALEELEHMTTVHVTPPEVQERLTREYTERIAAAEQRLRELPAEVESLPIEELHRVRRHLLNVEKDHILDAFRLGAMSDSTRDRLLADVEARWTRSELGADGLGIAHNGSEPIAGRVDERVELF
jgi:predicted nucleic acid-binding protein